MAHKNIQIEHIQKTFTNVHHRQKYTKEILKILKRINRAHVC